MFRQVISRCLRTAPKRAHSTTCFSALRPLSHRAAPLPSVCVPPTSRGRSSGIVPLHVTHSLGKRQYVTSSVLRQQVCSINIIIANHFRQPPRTSLSSFTACCFSPPLLLTCSSSNLQDDVPTSQELGKIEPLLHMWFTCSVCETRQQKTFSKVAYEEG